MLHFEIFTKLYSGIIITQVYYAFYYVDILDADLALGSRQSSSDKLLGGVIEMFQT